MFFRVLCLLSHTTIYNGDLLHRNVVCLPSAFLIICMSVWILETWRHYCHWYDETYLKWDATQCPGTKCMASHWSVLMASEQAYFVAEAVDLLGVISFIVPDAQTS